MAENDTTVTMAQYLDYDGELLAPGDTVQVPAEVAASWRTAGYVVTEAPPLRGVREPAPPAGKVRRGGQVSAG